LARIKEFNTKISNKGLTDQRRSESVSGPFVLRKISQASCSDLIGLTN